MFSTRRRALAALATAVLTLAPLSACGGDDQEPASADASTSTSESPDTDSADAGDAADSGDSGDSGDSDAATDGESVSVEDFVSTVTAAMQDKKTAHIVMELGSSVSAEADVRYGGKSPSMKMSMSMGGQEISMILVDNTMYMQQGAGGKYLKIDENTPGVGPVLEQMSNFGPQASITAMKKGLQDITRLGTETIDGEELTHYKVTVDAKAMADQLGGLTGAAGSQLPDEITYDFYVDGDNLMRQMNMDVAGQQIVMKVSDWGKPVEIKAPPKSQVQALP